MRGIIDIESFTSGRISLNPDGNTLRVQYCLGIGMYIVGLLGINFSCALFLMEGFSPLDVSVILFLSVPIIIGRLLFSLPRVHTWLKSIVLSTINEKAEPL